MSAHSYDKKSKFAQQDVIPAPNDVAALANRINKATHAIHNQINNLISLKMVFALRDPKIYRQGILSFYFVFKTFEELWLKELEKPIIDLDTLEKSSYTPEQIAKIEDDNRIREILKEVWTPALARTYRLQKDLAFYYNMESPEAFAAKFQEPIMKQQIDFVEHIRTVIPANPILILAYAHTLYLALFAGGRIMRSSIAKSTSLFPIVPGQTHEEVALKGTNLFNFDVEDEEALRVDFKRRYELATRSNLSEEEKLAIIAESEEIFKRNIAAVDEVAKKNQKAIISKFGYKASKFGIVAVLVLLIFLVFYQVRRMFDL